MSSLPFKFDVSRLKSKIEEVEAVTKKTIHEAAAALGVVDQPNSKKPNKMNYYQSLAQDIKPSLTEEQFLQITPNGFFEENFDTTRFILDLIPGEGEVNGESQEFSSFLDRNISQFSRSMDYVNSKIYSRVRKNYSEFVQGMSQIHEIGQELQRSTVMVASGRRTLNQTKKNLTSTAFNVMAKYNRRIVLQKMYYDLSQIKGIVRLERLLKQTLSDGDYPQTIKLYLECRDTITQHMHYHCIPDLDSNLLEIYEVVQVRLDKDFFNSCRSFDSEVYQRVFSAYKLLGKANKIHDKLKVYFVDPIEPETRNFVYSHVLLSVTSKDPETFKGMSYKELCKELKDEDFVHCLLSIFEYLCDVMTSLYLMHQYHEENPNKEEGKVFSDIKSALNIFKKSIWDIMQNQITYLLEPRKLINFKIDDFLLILNSVTKISEIGEEFSGNASHHLRQSIINQSKTYFENLHRSKIDDLRTMLENEEWVNIPVSNDFNAKTELRLNKKVHSNGASGGTNGHHSYKSDHIIQSIKEKGNPFSNLIAIKKGGNMSSTTSPALKSSTNTKKPDDNDDNDNDDESDDDEELKQDYIKEDDSDEEDDKKKNNNKKNQLKHTTSISSINQQVTTKLVSSTTISFVRHIGKYLEMMEQLPHISIDIFTGICQLIEYYMYSIYSFTGIIDPQGFSLESLTHRLENLEKKDNIEDLSFTKPLLHKFLNRMKERVGLPLTAVATAVVSNLASMPMSMSSFTNQFSKITNTIVSNVSNIGPSTNSPNLTSQSGTNTGRPSSSSTTNNNNPSNNNSNGIRWLTPKINCKALQLDKKDILYNLPLRMVAIESLGFISEAMDACKPVFEHLLPSNQTEILKDFYSNVVAIIPDLQKHLIKSSISFIFTFCLLQHGETLNISNTIASYKWEQVTQVSEKSSSYVAKFLENFKKFFESLNNCIEKYGQSVFTDSLRNYIVQLSFEYFIQQYVDGCSRVRAKKPANIPLISSNMIQDVTMIQIKLEKLASSYYKTPIKIPNMTYAMDYLKSFLIIPTFNQQDILQWAKEHDEYPIRFITALLTQAFTSDKEPTFNLKQLILTLEELERKRRAFK